MKFENEQMNKIKNIVEIFEENPDLKIESFPRDIFLQQAHELIDLASEAENLKLELFETQVNRNTLYSLVNSNLIKAIDLIKLFFGADSKELKKAGRKVTLEKRKHVRKSTEERLAETMAKAAKLQAEIDKKKAKGN